MKPILVHIHIFYPEMWAELKTKLAPLAARCPIHLFVTLVQPHLELEADIMGFDPAARIIPVENRGFDIGPFVQVIKSVNLTDYSYCIKLHSKRDMPSCAFIGHINFGGSLWRERLLSFLLPQNITKVLQAFEESPRLGMTGHFSLIMQREPTKFNFSSAVQSLLQQVGLTLRAYQFIAGTMFMCRAALLAPLQRLNLTFPVTERGVEDDRSLAHVMERFLGCSVAAQGYELRDCYSSHPKLRRLFHSIFCPLAAFLYRDVQTSSGKRMIKVCKVPVYISKQK